MNHPRISEDIGKIHDIDEFSFIGEIEEYYYKQQNQKVEIRMLQGRSETGGLFLLEVQFSDERKEILGYQQSFILIETVFGIKPDEVYVNFAGHIVYFIILNR